MRLTEVLAQSLRTESMSDYEDEIVQEFLVESLEALDGLDASFVALETNPDDREELSAVFRTMHTIKGTCGFLGFGNLENLAHKGENLLSMLRDGAMTLDMELTNALLATVDRIRDCLDMIAETQSDFGVETDDLVAELVALAEKARPDRNRQRQSTDTGSPRLSGPSTAEEPEHRGCRGGRRRTGRLGGWSCSQLCRRTSPSRQHRRRNQPRTSTRNTAAVRVRRQPITASPMSRRAPSSPSRPRSGRRRNQRADSRPRDRIQLRRRAPRSTRRLPGTAGDARAAPTAANSPHRTTTRPVSVTSWSSSTTCTGSTWRSRPPSRSMGDNRQDR